MLRNGTSRKRCRGDYRSPPDRSTQNRRDFSRRRRTHPRRVLHTLNPWRRDLFALAWDICTFCGHYVTLQLLANRLAVTRYSDIAPIKATHQTLYPDLAWAVFSIAFKKNVAF
ncbi:uncharacterized protein PHACADRAFT_246064 [Phanerochaete carnosa HHB-10118-sp]|uniref:Uncharacterized protein n=1 Tax=Phanerochaete carnosa (strain HHB-10118-sp) TaxID=650164 RepID=K5W8E4_PHACS|nr:uncharacterized protein PHACADRAFT_246064 [Phanerochaete carnosa HHB-10118-sp]EKM60223.1 hypothetical protein PHACADRAFT_246064 [Phanerochaete carnosa HHB-10118-sp]